MNKHQLLKKDAVLYSSYLHFCVSALALFIKHMVYVPTFSTFHIIQH